MRSALADLAAVRAQVVGRDEGIRALVKAAQRVILRKIGPVRGEVDIRLVEIAMGVGATLKGTMLEVEVRAIVAGIRECRFP